MLKHWKASLRTISGVEKAENDNDNPDAMFIFCCHVKDL